MSEQLTVDSALQSDLKEWKQNQNGLDIQIYIKAANILILSRILTKQIGFAACGSDGQHSSITLQFSFCGFVFSFFWQAHQQVWPEQTYDQQTNQEGLKNLVWFSNVYMSTLKEMVHPKMKWKLTSLWTVMLF